MGRKLIDLESQIVDLLDQLARATELNLDDAAIDVLIVQIDALEDKQRQQAKYLARKADESAAITALVDAGMSEVDATAKITGKDRDTVIKARFIAHARSMGYSGAGFDALITELHRDLASQAHAKAVEDCKGYMTRDKLTDGYHLWFASDATINARATDELIDWFEVNGRVTRSQLRANILHERPLVSTFAATR